MARSRKFFTVGALGVASFALIGAGATATFTDYADTSQSIAAGTISLRITDGAGGSVSADGHSVTLPTFGPTGSTFESTHRIIRVMNNGNVTVKSLAFQMSESHVGTANNNALLAQTNVCIQSTDTSGGPWTEGNGPLATAVALRPTVGRSPVTLAPGQSMTYSVGFYAGQDSENCSKTASDDANTRAAWRGHLGRGYAKPASLTNAAQGGVITPTLRFSFTG